MTKIYCNSKSLFWGDGRCNLSLNDTERCFDGGDCSLSASNEKLNTILVTINIGLCFLYSFNE